MSTSVVPLRTGGQIAPIIPTNIEEVFRLATAIGKSGLAPNGIKSPEQITIAIMHGMELGLPPMQAVQRIAVVNGRPTIWGDAIPALLYSRGFKIKEWSDETGAHCTVTRPDRSEITRSFTKAQAKTAGLWDKAGPWKQYPDRMLQMRARAYAARDAAADVLSGLYVREELDGGPLIDATPKPAPEPLELPDIPDEPPSDDVEPISDPAALIEKIKEDITMAKADGVDLGEVSEQYADLIERLPDDWKGKAEALFEAA
jgi:hypothetical protein